MLMLIMSQKKSTQDILNIEGEDLIIENLRVEKDLIENESRE